MRQAEFMILKEVHLEAGLDTSRASPIAKLDPYKDVSVIIRVGGRLQLANLAEQCIHPTILPQKSHFTNLLVKHYHERVHHQGKGITLNEIRANEYWILGVSSVVTRAISKCVTCRKLRSTHVKMSQLVASLQRSRRQVMFARLVTSCCCNSLVDIIRLVTRLFQQGCYNHDITILLQPCIFNLVTFLLYHDCIRRRVRTTL